MFCIGLGCFGADTFEAIEQKAISHWKLIGVIDCPFVKSKQSVATGFP
jgi:hypothetical protein